MSTRMKIREIIAEGGFFDPSNPNPGDMVQHRNGATGKVKKIGTQGDETWVYFKDQNGEMNYGLWKKHVFPVGEQGVEEGSADIQEIGRGYRGRSSWDNNTWTGDIGSRDKRDFKRREMEYELGDEERDQRNQDRGPWYLQIDGKVYKQKGQPKVFDWKRGANNYAVAIMKKKPELKDKIYITRSAEDK